MQYSEILGRYLSPGETAPQTAPQTVLINGVSIPVPQQPDIQTASEAQLKEYIEAQQLYQERVRDVTEGRERRDLLYEIPMDELVRLAEQQHREANDAEVRQLRMQSAVTWLPTEPRFKDTVENCEAIKNELDRRNLRGYVTDLQEVFESLAARGALDLNQVIRPKKVWTRDELMVMDPQTMAERIREMERDGVMGNLNLDGTKKG